MRIPQLSVTPALVHFQVVHGVIQVGNRPAASSDEGGWWVAGA